MLGHTACVSLVFLVAVILFSNMILSVVKSTVYENSWCFPLLLICGVVSILNFCQSGGHVEISYGLIFISLIMPFSCLLAICTFHFCDVPSKDFAIYSIGSSALFFIDFRSYLYGLAIKWKVEKKNLKTLLTNMFRGLAFTFHGFSFGEQMLFI